MTIHIANKRFLPNALVPWMTLSAFNFSFMSKITLVYNIQQNSRPKASRKSYREVPRCSQLGFLRSTRSTLINTRLQSPLEFQRNEREETRSRIFRALDLVLCLIDCSGCIYAKHRAFLDFKGSLACGVR